MRDSYLSNDVASTEATRAQSASTIRIGIVDEIQDNGTIRIRYYDDTHTSALPMSDSPHEAHIPSVNDLVYISPQSNSRDVVVGYAPIQLVEPLNDGERTIGHSGSESRLKFTDDGTIEVYRDGDSEPIVTISDSGVELPQAVVTDVSTTIDSDGYVTSVDTTTTETLSQ